LLLDKYITHNKNSNNYHLVVRSWREGESTEKLSTNAAFYNRVVPMQTTLSVSTKPGYFGFEWVSGFGMERLLERSAE